MTKKFIATINATHAGFINGNHTWYLEEDMANGVDTWISPYNKPVLVHHEMKKDAIGRVLSAKYVKMTDSKNGNKNYPKGFIQLEVEITDQEAVAKIKDRRYNTVSISTDARTARCSICNQDIAAKGLCEHERGKKYDGKKCFWYLGGLKYKEVSYVNAPADEYAETERFEEKEVLMAVSDSKAPMFQFEDSKEDPDCEKWDDYSEEDLALAHWLMVELDSELSEEDKVLSAKARKSMKTSTFCGPNRSFPVPDCAHVTAARRLIGRYKGPGNKSKILACVDRKAKAMGCDSSKSKDSIIGGNSMIITLNDALANEEVKKHLDSEIQKATQPLKDQLAGFSALNEKATKLEAEVKAKDSELSSVKDSVKKLEESVTTLKTEIHKANVTRVFDLRKQLQKKDVMALKDEKEVEVYLAELSKRTDESLTDAIADLSKEVVPEVKVDKTITQQADGTEPAKASDAVATSAAPATSAPKSRKERVTEIIFKD